MRLDLFSKDDSILLVGEGNFSFTVNLLKHELPISITATCFESEISYRKQQENVNYLQSRKIPVFFNVDATKLHENTQFHHKRFSKIIFNFPHVGGKMKIQLNRELLKQFFKSAKHVLSDDGSVIISLCRGQGGTPLDNPLRKWNDCWQITEMASHGGFILISVEPFYQDNFADYSCVGFRSQDVKFNLDGALVHIFVKGNCVIENLNLNAAQRRMKLTPFKGDEKLLVPIIYSELYKVNPLSNPKSAISFFKELVIQDLIAMSPLSKLVIVTENEVPFHMINQDGVLCEMIADREHYSLRQSAYDVLNLFFQKYGANLYDKYIFFPGLYFKPLEKDFKKQAPVEVEFLLLGKNLLNFITIYIKNLLNLFKEENANNCIKSQKSVTGSVTNKIINGDSSTQLMCKLKGAESFEAASFHNFNYDGASLEVCIMNVEELCRKLFKANSWREVWAEKSEVTLDICQKPVLKQYKLFPMEYKFDITLQFNEKEEFSEDKFYEILWLAAGQIIEQVDLVSEFHSCQGWSSRCYRITYRSLDRSFCRSEAIDIQSKLIGPMLEIGLNVSIK